jgi:hypothetical protein
MPDSETNSSDWNFRHALPFLRLLRETESACWDGLTGATPGNHLQPIERGHEREVQTAAWRAMRSWRDELAPYYEKLISTPGLATICGDAS